MLLQLSTLHSIDSGSVEGGDVLLDGSICFMHFTAAAGLLTLPCPCIECPAPCLSLH